MREYISNQVSISIVMPAYNASRYIGEAIDSVLAQTYKDFELVIVNDGSTDNTVDIINSYRDPRIRLIHNPKNMGIVATLNNGIKEARAKYIARLDADDVAMPQRLELQLNYLKAHPDVELLGSWGKTFVEDTNDCKDLIINNNDLAFNLLFFNPIIHSSVVFKKATIMREGMYRQNYAEDFDLWSRMLHKYKMHILEESLVFYRLTDVSLCRVVYKTECDLDAQRIAMRNIRYYMGEDYDIPENILDMLTNRLSTIRNTQDVSLMKESIAYYDDITEAIIKTEREKDVSLFTNLPEVVNQRRKKIIYGYVKGLKLISAYEFCKSLKAMEIFNENFKKRVSRKMPILKTFFI